MPLKLKEPSKIFTCSLTDFFHKEIDGYLQEAWDIIRRCPQHKFQILTKRPERILQCLPEDWGEGWDNVWLGTSCGSNESAQRAAKLCSRAIKCKVKFLSLEPLHGPFSIADFLTEKEDNDAISWVIVGGESGNDTGQYQFRKCMEGWICDIVDRCQSAGVPVFVKQLGTDLARFYKLKDRHGGDMDEWPDHLKVREFPTI